MKLWEGSLDLVKRLHSEVHKGELVLRGKSVLEVGCLIPGDICAILHVLCAILFKETSHLLIVFLFES